MKRTITRSLRTVGFAVAIGFCLVLLVHWTGYGENITTPVIERAIWIALMLLLAVGLVISTILWLYTAYMFYLLARLTAQSFRNHFLKAAQTRRDHSN